MGSGGSRGGAIGVWEFLGRSAAFAAVLLLAIAFARDRWGEGAVLAVLGFNTIPALLAMFPWGWTSSLRFLRLLCAAAAAAAGALFMLTMETAVAADGFADAALAIALAIGVAGTWAADLTIAHRAEQDADRRHREVLEAVSSDRVLPQASKPQVRDVALLLVAWRLLRR